MQHLPNYTDQAQGMSALLTSTYNTGWMNGDIKGAFLADTDDTDLVGSGELVTNGTFDTDTSGWTVTASGTFTYSAGTGILEQVSGTNANVSQAITTVVGQRYRMSASVSGTSCRLLIGTSQNLGDLLAGPFTTGVLIGDFVATTTTTYIHIQSAATVAGLQSTIDDVSVKLADADRSVNNNGLIVNGTITRSPVADGAELVGYSGFSAANYLEQPYSSALDFGTGDFCVMGWASCVSTSAQCLLHRGDGDATGWNVGSIIQIEMSTNLKAGVYTSGFADQSENISFSGTSFANGQMRFVCLARKAGVLRLYVDGLEVGSVASDIDATNTSASLWLGQRPFSSRPWSSGSLALWRISATAPTADQILKIYNDEKALFQDNAACTLYGASDAVTALAHDPDTDLLHVGTSAGRSVFYGLRRLNNTTTPVTTAISAANGIIGEQ
jgi:hypothetical protein